jgi:hypothetical protein
MSIRHPSEGQGFQLTFRGSRSAESRAKHGGGVSRPFMIYPFHDPPGKPRVSAATREISVLSGGSRSATHVPYPRCYGPPLRPFLRRIGSHPRACALAHVFHQNLLRSPTWHATAARRPTLLEIITFSWPNSLGPPRVQLSSEHMLPMQPAAAAERPTLDQGQGVCSHADRGSTRDGAGGARISDP